MEANKRRVEIEVQSGDVITIEARVFEWDIVAPSFETDDFLSCF